MKPLVKQIIARAIGLLFATFFAGTGVGAIALANMGTPFSINNSANNQLGLVRNSGIFLQQNGQAGTIQHVDLTV